MFKTLIIALMCCCGYQAVAQPETRISATHTDNATATWDFLCERYALTGILSVQLTKTAKGAGLRLSATVSDPAYYIGGTVYLFLADNTIITCTDKGMRYMQQHTAIANYVLTTAEINKLKTTRITDIRFAILGRESAFSSQTGNFTAINRKQYFDVYNDRNANAYPTETEIAELYK